MPAIPPAISAMRRLKTSCASAGPRLSNIAIRAIGAILLGLGCREKASHRRLPALLLTLEQRQLSHRAQNLMAESLFSNPAACARLDRSTGISPQFNLADSATPESRPRSGLIGTRARLPWVAD